MEPDRRLAGSPGVPVVTRHETRCGMTVLKSRMRAVLRGREIGMTTAEYAVGTVAACGFGGILYKILTSPEVAKMLRDLIARALSIAF